MTSSRQANVRVSRATAPRISGTRVVQTAHSATTNQAANGACRTVSCIVVPPAEAGVEDIVDLWFTARNSDVRVMNASGRIRLDSWKGIPGYLKTSVRTVQRWEKYEGLPVHRHAHARQDTVYAYTDEIEEWRSDRNRHGTKGGKAGFTAITLL